MAILHRRARDAPAKAARRGAAGGAPAGTRAQERRLRRVVRRRARDRSVVAIARRDHVPRVRRRRRPEDRGAGEEEQVVRGPPQPLPSARQLSSSGQDVLRDVVLVSAEPTKIRKLRSATLSRHRGHRPDFLPQQPDWCQQIRRTEPVDPPVKLRASCWDGEPAPSLFRDRLLHVVDRSRYCGSDAVSNRAAVGAPVVLYLSQRSSRQHHQVPRI